jgi:hypothetical protein
LIRSLHGEAPPDTPLARAQDVLDTAFEEPNEDRKIALAKEALAISPDCADAYVLLAEHTRSRKKALELFEKGVMAGERVLGPEAFQRDVGHFWGILESRPYMRAREGLALALWTAGRRDEAIAHLQDMLRLNPHDNQGLRYTLASFYLFLDRDEDLAGLLEQYADDGTANWTYTRALLAFRQNGDTPATRDLLRTARKANKHVPKYLTGRKYPPSERPGPYTLGDDSEALNYISVFMAAWKFTPGAIAWLRANTAKRKEGDVEAPQPKGPLGFIKKWLIEHLPQEYDVWQVDARQTPNWIRIGGEMVRPWVILVTSRSNDLVLANQIAEERPSSALLWDLLVQGMHHPAAGEAHRPSEIQVRSDERWESLRSHLEEIGVGLAVSEELDQLAEMFQGLSQHLCGKPEPGLLDMPGVTPGQVACFYEAAALFFRLAPWKKVGYEAAIKVESDRYRGGPWYAVLMGQSGLLAGLALYDDLGTLSKLLATGGGSDEENARETVVTTMSFGEEWTIPVADLEAAKKYGWPVVRPDAYPDVFHKERGMATRRPLAWELELMEGCVRAVPNFVTRRIQDDPAREEITVPVASGPLKLVLSWVTEP